MKKTKECKKMRVGAHDCAQNGITLIALIITIIVMLILVSVTITMAINGGLFEKAQQAGQETNKAVEAEQQLANGQVKIDGKVYASIDDYIAGKAATLSYEETEKKDGVLTAKATWTVGNKTAVIPKGFAVSNIAEEKTIENGLVITDAVDSEGNTTGNEFVWIPVEKAIVTEAEIDKIIKDSESTAEPIDTPLEAVQKMVNNGIYPMAVEVNTKDESGNVIATNYKGILYKFTQNEDNTLKLDVYDWTGTSYREPANLEAKKTFSAGTTVNGTTFAEETKYPYDSQEMFTLYGGGTYSGTTMYQEAYNKMVKSVAENGGFYVGRYEISNENGLDYVETKKDKTALVSKTWYEMYKLEKAYAEKNTGLGVTSEMIWGSQWDQMMLFVNGKNDGATTPASFYVAQNGTRKSGSPSTKTGMNIVDQVANIFDLEASRYEWTQEANSSNLRVNRGGSYNDSVKASYRFSGSPTGSDDRSSRAALYLQ